MKRGEGPGTSTGLTVAEVLAILGVIAIFLGLLIPVLSRAKGFSDGLACVNWQKNLGLGFRIFSTDHGGRFPFEVGTNQGGTLEFVSEAADAWRHFAVSVGGLNSSNVVEFLVCRSDSERKPARTLAGFTNNAHLSYFLALNANSDFPGSLLLGDRNLSVDGSEFQNRIVQFSTNRAVRFSGRMHDGRGALTMADGSVQQLDSLNAEHLFHSLTNAPNVVFP